MSNQEWVSKKVSQYLEGELASGDSSRIKAAQQATEANRAYGIGGWFQKGRKVVSLSHQEQNMRRG